MEEKILTNSQVEEVEVMTSGYVQVVDETEEPEEPVETVTTVANDICIGVVSDCDRLNVRKTPSRNALVVAEIDVDTEVMIDLDNSTAGWYNICTATGVEGFCMKDFITVNK